MNFHEKKQQYPILTSITWGLYDFEHDVVISQILNHLEMVC